MLPVSSPFYPDSIEDYKVHRDTSLVSPTLALLEYCLAHNQYEVDYVRKYTNLQFHNFYKSMWIQNNRDFFIPERLKNDFYTKVISTINNEWDTVSCRLEIMNPCPEIEGKHNRAFRFNELYGNSKPVPMDGKITHPSLCWHFDSKSKLNNMVSIIYLSDVSEYGGGTTLADPVIRAIPKEDNVDGVGISNTPINVEDIKFKTITGKAGTTVTFNSYSLHRGGIPIDKPRIAAILNYLPRKNRRI